MPPEIGDPAPDFALRDQAGRWVHLTAFRGAKNVVIVFYPYSFTATCEGELCSLRDEIGSFQNDNAQLLAISVDSVPVHRKWGAEQGFDFPILADFWPHGHVARAYGVLDEASGSALRGTFVIDREGVVRWKVVQGIRDARNPADYEAVLAELAVSV